MKKVFGLEDVGEIKKITEMILRKYLLGENYKNMEARDIYFSKDRIEGELVEAITIFVELKKHKGDSKNPSMYVFLKDSLIYKELLKLFPKDTRSIFLKDIEWYKFNENH